MNDQGMLCCGKATIVAVTSKLQVPSKQWRRITAILLPNLNSIHQPLCLRQDRSNMIMFLSA
jgi:hypothetical protein